MFSLQHIDSVPVSPFVLPSYEAVMGALGSETFAGEVTNAVARLAHVDRLYLFALQGAPLDAEALVQVYEPDKPPIEHTTYLRHYLPMDPVQRVMETATPAQGLVQIRVEPRDIVAAGYRQKLEDAGILERVSWLQGGHHASHCMTVARKSRSGPFRKAELDLLGGFARLLMPLARRHQFLTGAAQMRGPHAIPEIECRFGRRFPQLTLRERQACARAVVGMTAEGAALELGIALSSVLTYRKRAFRRLGVSSAGELAALIMR